MYAEHFGLKAEAFSLTPDPSFLYLSPGHREALAALEIGLRNRRGLIVMTGEVGTGKTTLLYSLLGQLESDVQTAYISNTKLSFDQMLFQALTDLGVPCASRDQLELLTALNAFLHTCATAGMTAALVIDEAQNLDNDTFENLRLLSNFETFTTKLLQIVLVGQPELEFKLSNPSLRQVAERVAVHCHLKPLSRAESRSYIAHRLRCAGGSLELFSRGALRLAVSKSQGIPRRINIICHNALLFAYGHSAQRVSRSLVRAAAREREGLRLVKPYGATGLWRKRWPRPGVAVPAMLVATIGTAALNWNAVRPWLDAIAVAPSSRAPAGSPEVSSPVTHGAQDPLKTAASLTAQHPVFAYEADETEERLAPQRVDESPPPNSGARGAMYREAEDASVAARAAAPAPAVNKNVDDGRSVGQSTASLDHPGFRTVRVAPGATLVSLAREIYGAVSPDLLTRIRLANPQIADPNHILTGDTLRFPAVQATSVPNQKFAE